MAVAPASALAAAKRKLLFAVDNKEGSIRALQWILQNIVRKGDVVHLAHVITNPRTPMTSVDSSGAGGFQWSPQPEMPQLTKEWNQRLEERGRTMVMENFVPLVREAGCAYEVDMLKQRGATSAAGIGELICSRASKVGADLVFIASHGGGVLADYGSVAQYCAKHSPVPAVLLPPGVINGSPAAAPGNGVMVVAIDDLAGLEKATKFAVKHLHIEGEKLWAVSVQNWDEPQACEDGEALCTDINQQQQLEKSVRGWAGSGLAEELVNVQALLNVSNTEPDSEHSIVGDNLVSVSSSSAVRLVVMADSNKNNIMREVMYGNITNYFLRHCKVPVAVLP